MTGHFVESLDIIVLSELESIHPDILDVFLVGVFIVIESPLELGSARHKPFISCTVTHKERVTIDP